MGKLIDDKYPFLSFLFWLLGAAFVVALVYALGYAFHQFWSPLLDHLTPLATPISQAAARSLAQLPATFAEKLAEGTAEAIAIPVGVVVITKIYQTAQKSEKARRAWIIAIGAFLNPIFADFLKDELPKQLLSSSGEAGKEAEGLPFARIVLAILFSAIFLAATLLFEKKGRSAKILGTVLYLTPLIAAVGYLIRFYGITSFSKFLESLTPVEWIGLAGLALTAVFGIYLSRSYSPES